MSNPFKRKQTPLAIVASLSILVGVGVGTAYATVCIPPYESLTLELVGVTEEGAPVTNRTAYDTRRFELIPESGYLVFQIAPKDGMTNASYEYYQR